MGDFEEVECLQAGIRRWLLLSVRGDRQELRYGGGSALLRLLCAAAFGPALAGTGASGTAAAAGPRMGVLATIGADTLARLLAEADGRARSAQLSGDDQALSAQQDLSRLLEREISRSVGEAFAAGGPRADDLRSDIAMVLREIDAGGTVLRAAIEAGDSELEHEVLTAFEALSAEFGDMAFMLADLARAAGEIQDSLGGQDAELRAASAQVGRQAADVRMVREELAVIEERARQWQPEQAGRAEPRPRWTGGCPYRGLLPYDQAHEAVFRGRERLTAELAGKLAGAGMVIVTGASGAGKTSLLRAGLMPALARGVQVPGSSSWPVIGLTATARPLTSLAAALAPLDGRDPAAVRQRLAAAPGEAHLLIREITRQAGDAARLVLIIDQFERVFTADGPDDRAERAAFIDAVCTAATRPAGPRGVAPARVVIAVRGDCWDRCAAYPQLIKAMERDQLVVGPMPEADLRRAVAGPAEASGMRVESALIDAVVADARAAGPASALPPLSHALALTWENREGDQLTREGYERAGRIARAVEVSAEAVYGGLAENQREVTRDLLRRMTAAGQDGRPARRPVSLTDLRAGLSKDRQAEAGAVLDAFARSRLVALGAGTAELAHDVLLEAWPRLRDWLDEDQSSLILYGQLAEDTARWRQDGRDSARLYRGVQLAAAREAARVWAADPGRYPVLPAAEAEFLRASERAGTRGRWGRRTLAGALVLLLLAALGGAGLAVRSARNTASQQRTENVSVRLAAQSTAMEAADPATAALLAGAAWRIAPTAQARYSLLQSLAQPVRGVLAAQAGVVTAVIASPDGKTLAAGYLDGTIRLWDAASHRLISTATWNGSALALAFADHGKALVIAGPAGTGTWNLGNGARITARPLAGLTAPGSGSSASGSSASGASSVVALSPDGKTLATGGQDGNIRLWDAATQQEIGAPMSSGLEPVETVAFSRDGTMLAAASSGGTIQLWDVATRQEAGTTMAAGAAAAAAAGAAAAGALAFSPDGKLLAAGGQDGNVRLWDVTTHGQRGVTMAAGSAVTAMSFSADGATLATAEGGATGLWAVATQKQTGAALAAPGSAEVSALAFDAGLLATGSGNGTIELWDPDRFHQSSAQVATGTVRFSAGHAPAAFSARGDVLAVSVGRGRIRVRNALTGRAAGSVIATHQVVTGLALSPDGKTLAVVGNGLQLWSTATGQRTVVSLPGAGPGGPVAFSPDGTLVAAVGVDGRARVWSVATQRETGAAVNVGRQAVLAFSPGGRTFAAAGADGSIRLWDVATQQEIGAPMTASPAPVYALAFSPDGTTLAAAASSGTRRWDVAFPADLLAAACAIADQTLTRQQWAGYAGTEPFQQVCPAS